MAAYVSDTSQRQKPTWSYQNNVAEAASTTGRAGSWMQIHMDSTREGFESLALTYKKAFALCTPFVEHHNKLRSHFRDFTYYNRLDDPSYNIKTAFDLITRIAVEPVVARYVRHADFKVSDFQMYRTSLPGVSGCRNRSHIALFSREFV